MAAVIGAVGAAGAAAAKQMADTLERFRVADATAPDRAQSLESLGLQQAGVVDRLLSAGVILPGSRAGRFYLSEVAVAAFQRRNASRQRLMAAAAVALALAGFLVVFFLIMAGSHPGRAP